MIVIAGMAPSAKTPTVGAERTPAVVEASKQKPAPEQPKVETQPVSAVVATVVDDPNGWMDAAGIAPSDRQYVVKIMGQESGWTLSATNYLGCIGLGQACPSGNKGEMLARCPDWATNGTCQMKVWNDYAMRRYGSWSYAAQWKFCTGVCYNAHTRVSVDKKGEPWW